MMDLYENLMFQSNLERNRVLASQTFHLCSFRMSILACGTMIPLKLSNG